MTPIERINIIAKKTNKSLASLAKSIDRVPQVFYDIKSGKVKEISLEIAVDIAKKYPQFSTDWIMNEEGPMLNGASNIEAELKETYEEKYIGLLEMVVKDQKDSLAEISNRLRSIEGEQKKILEAYQVTQALAEKALGIASKASISEGNEKIISELKDELEKTFSSTPSKKL